MTTAKPMPSKWSDFSPYLKGAMMGDKTYTLTIKGIGQLTTHPNGKAKESPILSFMETQKVLILTPTHMAVLAALFGDAIANCIGSKIVVASNRRTVAGKECHPIYIQAANPKAAPPPPPAQPAQPAQPEATE